MAIPKLRFGLRSDQHLQLTLISSSELSMHAVTGRIAGVLSLIALLFNPAAEILDIIFLDHFALHGPRSSDPM